jgi:hypothetical protein
MGVAFISDMLLVCCAQMPGETAVQIISGSQQVEKFLFQVLSF